MKGCISLVVLFIVAVICMAVIVPAEQFGVMFVGLVAGCLIAGVSCMIAH